MKINDIIEPSLSQLFNAQKARVYEYFIVLHKADPFFHTSWIHNITFSRLPLTQYETLDEFPHLKSKWDRVIVAKKRFEAAGGNYVTFK